MGGKFIYRVNLKDQQVEYQFLMGLLSDETFGWLGWLLTITAGVTLGIGLLVKTILGIAKSVKEIKEYFQNDKDEGFRIALKKEADVTGLLQDLKHELYADRLLVLQYHNGIYSIAHNHLSKVTATHEVITSNTPSIIRDVQGWPASFFGTFNEVVLDKGVVKLPKVLIDTPEESATVRALHDYLLADQVLSVYLFPLSDSYGKVFGFGMVQYVKKEHTMTNDEIAMATQRFTAIGNLLAGVPKA